MAGGQHPHSEINSHCRDQREIRLLAILMEAEPCTPLLKLVHPRMNKIPSPKDFPICLQAKAYFNLQNTHCRIIDYSNQIPQIASKEVVIRVVYSSSKAP